MIKTLIETNDVTNDVLVNPALNRPQRKNPSPELSPRQVQALVKKRRVRNRLRYEQLKEIKRQGRLSTQKKLRILLAHKLASIGKFFSVLPKGFEEGVFFMLQAAESDEEVERLVSKWQQEGMTFEDPNVFDDIAKRMHIDPMHVLEQCCKAAHHYTSMISFAIADMSMPEVVKASAREAVKPQGIEDRNFLGKATNFLPQPKGVVFNNVNALRNEDNSTEQNLSISLPSFDSDAVSSCDQMREGTE